MSSIDRRIAALEGKAAPRSFRTVEIVVGPTMTRTEAEELRRSEPPFDPRRDVVTSIELIGVRPDADIIPFIRTEELH